MNQIFKVAKMFQKKLALAANMNLQNLKAICQAAENLSRTKKLWIEYPDPYEDSDAFGNAIDNISKICRRANSQATTYGMPVQGQYSYMVFLTNLSNAVSSLEALGPFPQLDTRASTALSQLKAAVSKAIATYVPVAIYADQPVLRLPQDTITGTPPSPKYSPVSTVAPAGAAYKAPPAGADPEALTDVVDRLVQQNR